VGFLFGGAPWLLLTVCLIWGISVIADSAQFSASITELSDKEHVGTMLTLQTCMGFLLTLITIQLMPLLVDAVGWRYAFAALAVGPLLGVVAMARLRRHPDAKRLAGGRG
jgi:MFS family permease